MIRSHTAAFSALLLGLAASSCAPGTSARSPECNARINNCMKSCGNGPEVTSPRAQTVATPGHSNTPQDPCSQRCNNMCK